MTRQPQDDTAHQRNRQKGATTVEYAVIIVAMVLAVFATVIYLADPNDHENSLLPATYTKVGNHVGHFDIKNIAE